MSIILFLLLVASCATTATTQKHDHTPLQRVSVLILIENGGKESLCANISQTVCEENIRTLFAPIQKRFRSEFGIALSIHHIRFSWNHTAPKPKQDIAPFEQYLVEINRSTAQMRKHESFDIALAIMDQFSDHTSENTSARFGTVLVNSRDPVLQWSIMHGIAHMFCANDTSVPGTIMYDYGTNYNEPFSAQNKQRIIANKSRSFGNIHQNACATP